MVTLLLTEQLTVLFLMMGCGFVLVKTKIVKSRDSKTLSLISVYLIMPCVIINAFQIDYSKEIQDGFLLALFSAVIIHLLLFLICGILGKFLNLTSVEKASLIYSNAGNLIIPLVTSVLGSEWVIYSSGFMCVQTLLLWTHAQSIMQGKTEFNWKKILQNVNLIAIVVGIILFFFHIKLPVILSDTINSLASLIGPVSMIMLGMLLTEVDWKALFTSRRIYLMTALKMLVLPLIMVGCMRILAHHCSLANASTILLISLLATITPSATTITQMAQIYDNHPDYASAINVFTTVVCIVTMPIMVLLYTL